MLVLVSNGFLALSPETMKMKSEIMDLAATSDVIVNALDARGLYAGNLDASHGGSTSTIGLVTGQLAQNHLASMQANEMLCLNWRWGPAADSSIRTMIS